MRSKKIFLTAALSLVIVNLIAANSYAQEQSGERRGPPQEAFDACTGQSEGASCAFTATRGDVSGSCLIHPREQQLICAPAGGAKQGGQRPRRESN